MFKRFLSALMAFMMLLSVLSPVASCVEFRTGNRQNILFDQVDRDSLDLNLFNNGISNDLKVEKLEDDDIVKIFIILDDPSVLEKDSSAVYGEDTQAYMDLLSADQDALISAIESSVLNGDVLDISYRYTWLLNGIAAEVSCADLRKIEKLPGVKQVLLQPRYEACKTSFNTSDSAELMTTTTGSMINRDPVWANGYTGKGVTIAVIDTGLDVDHQNFQELPEEKLTDGSVDERHISALLQQLNAYTRYEDLTSSDLYYNSKVVYGFNYADNNLDITHDNDIMGDHGTHVAGIAAANKVDESEVVGVAPDAQLYIMKVYGADHGGYSEDIMAALEDALMLGADVINMSLGTNSGFTTSTEEVNAIYNRVAQTKTVLCVAAGNNYTSGYGNTWGTDANQTKYPDNAVIGEPAVYNNVLSVASVENWFIQRNYIAAGDKKLAFVETTASYEMPSVLTLEGEYSLAVVPGVGATEDYEGLDVTGKIALVQRGGISFVEKCENAAAAGAIACIVYNTSSEEFGMDLTDCTATIPCISVTMEDGQFLAESAQADEDFVISFPKELTSLPSLKGYQMSDFSSWGVAPDLSLEPDITAPGGNIYSTVTDGGYDLMSGTSMATPHMAGISALMVQYVQENYPDLDMPIREFIQNILVSTAVPLTYDAESGLYYTPRHQGAGLANVFNAICAQVYLTVEGVDTPKAELGDDPDRTGHYTFDFNVTNFGSITAYYSLNTVVQTEDYMTVEGYEGVYFMSGTPLALDALVSHASENLVLMYDVNDDGVTDGYDAYLIYLAATGVSDGWQNQAFRYDLNGDEEVTTDDVQLYLNALVGLDSSVDLSQQALKVEGGKTATVTVTIDVQDSGREYLDTYYVNGGYVEGFTFLNALHDDVDLSLAYLGFYGSWDEAPILDDGFYWDYVDSEEATEEEPTQPEEDEDSTEPTEGADATEPTGADEPNPDQPEEDFDEKLEGDALNYGIIGNQYINVLWTQFYGMDSYFYPGFNAYVSEEFDVNHISLSPNGDGYIDTIDDIYISLLRNARYLTFRYVDADTGEVYYDQTVEYVSKSAYSSSYGQILPSVYSWFEGEIELYDFTDNNGNTLANNTHLLLQVEAIGDYEGATVDAWEVPITIDVKAPELIKVEKVTDENGKVWLEMSYRDNHSVAAIALLSSSGKETYHLEGVVDPEADADGYRNYTARYDITDVTGKLMIVLADYALNESVFALNMGGEGEPYGALVAYQYNFYDETFGWVSFDEGVDGNEVQITLEEMDIACAEYVNGFVFAQKENGALYGFRYTDMLKDTFNLETAYITQLEYVYADFSYSYVDGKLYGLLSYEDEVGYPTSEIYSININGYCTDEVTGNTLKPFEETWAQGRGGVYGLCMSVRTDGTFYVLGVGEDDTTQMWMSYYDSTIADGMLFKKIMDIDVPMDYRQSMTWDHNTDTLYWAQFNPTSVFTYDADLYIIDVDHDDYEVVGTLSGETVGMFAPVLPETVASNDVFLNVPEMDTSIVGKPILRTKVANMNLGGTMKLIHDLDPWYTDHKDVIWSSSDEAVVTVDQNGNLTAIGTGSAQVKVASVADPSKFDVCDVNVSALTLNIEGIVTDQGSGIGMAGGSRLYKYVMEEGLAAMQTYAPITASGAFSGYGLDIATSVIARDHIWVSEYGNAGMIYKIDPATGEVVDMLQPVDGDMLFGMTYNEQLDTFAGIMNMYLFVDLEMTHEEQDKMQNSYDEEAKQFTYHRLNLLEYLIAAGGNYMTGENGQGASSEIVMCGITTIADAYKYVDTTTNFLGEYTSNASTYGVDYTSTQTLVILDNVGRLWYIDEICGMKKSGNYFKADDGSKIHSKREGVLSLQNEDGTYNVFYIRTIEDTPLTDMFNDGSLPRITYHFSDIEFGGYTEDGAPIFAMSLYDYWNEGTTNELYVYTPEVSVYDDTIGAYRTVGEDKLYWLGTTGEYKIIASIHSFEVLGGLDD